MKKTVLVVSIFTVILLVYVIFKDTSGENGMLQFQWKDNTCFGMLVKEDGTREEKTGESFVNFDKEKNQWIIDCQLQGGYLSLHIFYPNGDVKGNYSLADFNNNSNHSDSAVIKGIGFSTVHYEKKGYKGIILKKLTSISGTVEVRKLSEDGSYPLEIVGDAQVKLVIPRR